MAINQTWNQETVGNGNKLDYKGILNTAWSKSWVEQEVHKVSERECKRFTEVGQGRRLSESRNGKTQGLLMSGTEKNERKTPRPRRPCRVRRVA